MYLVKFKLYKPPSRRIKSNYRTKVNPSRLNFRHHYSTEDIDPDKLENIDQEIKFQPHWDDHKRNFRIDDVKISLHTPSGPIGPAIPPPPLPTVKYWSHRKLLENEIQIVKGFRIFEKNIKNLADSLKKSKDDKVTQLLNNSKDAKYLENIQQLSDNIDNKLFKFYDLAYACRHIWKYELASIRRSEDMVWRRFTKEDWENMKENELIYWRNFILSTKIKDMSDLERQHILSNLFESSMIIMKECDDWYDLMMKVELVNKSRHLTEKAEAEWQEKVQNSEWAKAINACVNRMLEFDKKAIQNRKKLVLYALNYHIRQWNKEHLAYLLELKAIYDWGRMKIDSKYTEPTRKEALEKWDKCVFRLARNIQQLRKEGPFFIDVRTFSQEDYDFLYNEMFQLDTENIGEMLDSDLFLNVETMEKNKALFETTLLNSVIDEFNFEDEFKNHVFNITTDNYDYINLIYNDLMSNEINPYILLRDLIIKANQDKYYNTVEYLSSQFDLDSYQIENAVKLSSYHKNVKNTDNYSHSFNVDKDLLNMEVSEEEYKLMKNLDYAIEECEELPNWIVNKFNYFSYGKKDPSEAFADTTDYEEDPQDILDILETVQELFVDIEVPNKKNSNDPMVKYDFDNFNNDNTESLNTNIPEIDDEHMKDLNTIKTYVRGLRFSNSNAVLWLKSLNQESLKKLPININPNIWNQNDFDEFIKSLDDTSVTFVQVPVFIRLLDQYAEKAFSKLSNQGALLLQIKFLANQLSRAYRYEKDETKNENNDLVDKYEFMFQLYLKVNGLDVVKEVDPTEQFYKEYIVNEIEKTLPNGVLSWMFHFAMTPFRFLKNVILLPSPKKQEPKVEDLLSLLVEEDSVKPWKLWNVKGEQDIKNSEYFNSMSSERAKYWTEEIELWNHQYKKQLIKLGVSSNFGKNDIVSK